jgi:hypothetical protein
MNLETITNEIKNKRNIFVFRLEINSDNENQNRPPNEWSLMELIEHLILAEEKLLDLIINSDKQMDKRTLKDFFMRKIVSFVMSNGVKVPVPSKNVEPIGNLSKEKLINRCFDLDRKLDFINIQNLSLYCFTHPIAGPLTAIETLEFISLHLTYHLKRAKKLSLI